VSIDFPFLIAAAEAPDPRWSEISDISSGGCGGNGLEQHVIDGALVDNSKGSLSGGTLQPPLKRMSS
jgi:hypothetical protein